MLFASAPSKHAARTLVGLAFAAALSACAAPVPPATPYDPNETYNRQIHEFNKGLDRTLVKPVANTYGAALPAPVRQGISNISGNLGTPNDVVNDLLQARPADALHNTLRFAFNTTLGLVGLFDVATPLGLEERKTDFGETLHVWGAGEGAYVELPLIGPSTERDTVGVVLDILLDPLDYVLPSPEKYAGTVARVGSRLGDRYRYSNTLDSVLYDSADSYAQARLLYLQNRRYELGQAADSEADFLDPYEDPYAE